MAGGWDEVQPFSRGAEICSSSRLLSSKRYTIAFFLSKQISPNGVGEIWKGQQGVDIAGNIAEDYIFSASPAPFFLTVLAELWLFFFLSNPLLCYSGGELEPVISGLNSPCEWRDFGQTGWEEDSQLWVPTETHLSFYRALCCWRERSRGVTGLDKRLAFHCWFPGR